jgi:hypothetical protein
MLGVLLRSIEQSFTILICASVYWFLWVMPAIDIGRTLVLRLSSGNRDWLSCTLHGALFIVFAFPSVLVAVLCCRLLIQ